MLAIVIFGLGIKLHRRVKLPIGNSIKGARVEPEARIFVIIRPSELAAMKAGVPSYQMV
jgi:hypothetical protein